MASAGRWCFRSIHVATDAAGAGFCSIIDAQGDITRVWFRTEGQGQATWGVIGGTGANEGATGGGTSSFVARGGDGGTWIGKSRGTTTDK
jgi:hypothetical protein